MFDGSSMEKSMTKKNNKKLQASTRQNHEKFLVDHQEQCGAAIAGGESLIYISPSRVCSIYLCRHML